MRMAVARPHPHGMLIVTLAVLLLAAHPASACPFCEAGPDGVGENEVRQAIFGEEFWFHLFAIAAPLLVLSGTVALIHFDVTTLWRRRAMNGRSEA